MEEAEIKLQVEYRQESDCMQNDNLGQNLIIRTESDGVSSGSFFIIETDRWSFDNIEEFIEILKAFKQKYDLIKKFEE